MASLSSYAFCNPFSVRCCGICYCGWNSDSRWFLCFAFLYNGLTSGSAVVSGKWLLASWIHATTSDRWLNLVGYWSSNFVVIPQRKRGCPPKIIIWELLLGSRGCFLEWRISVRHWRNKSLRGGLLGLAVSLLQPLLHLAIAVLLKSLSSSGSCILILLLEQGLAVVSSPRRRLVVLAKGIKRPRHCVQAVKVLPRGYQRFFIDNCCCSAVLSSSAENRLYTPYIAAATHPRATCGCG